VLQEGKETKGGESLPQGSLLDLTSARLKKVRKGREIADGREEGSVGGGGSVSSIRESSEALLTIRDLHDRKGGRDHGGERRLRCQPKGEREGGGHTTITPRTKGREKPYPTKLRTLAVAEEIIHSPPPLPTLFRLLAFCINEPGGSPGTKERALQAVGWNT